MNIEEAKFARLVYDLNMAHDMIGGFLDPELKLKIVAYSIEPSRDLWNDIFGIILNSRPLTTLWQAVCIMDDTFPRRGRVTDSAGKLVKDWEKIPSPELVARAVRYATH